MRHAVMALCVLVLFGCTRESEVVETDTMATVDTAATGTSATTATVTTTIADADRYWGPWSEWDTDNDNRLARNEFDARFDGVYDRWDIDRSGSLSRDELADTWRDLWDNNNDDIIDEEEWKVSTDNWKIEGVDFKNWREWDIDNDGRADANEFRQGFASVYNFFDTDRNNDITRDELRQKWFDVFDGNDDDIIDANEWRERTS